MAKRSKTKLLEMVTRQGQAARAELLAMAERAQFFEGSVRYLCSLLGVADDDPTRAVATAAERIRAMQVETANAIRQAEGWESRSALDQRAIQALLVAQESLWKLLGEPGSIDQGESPMPSDFHDAIVARIGEMLTAAGGQVPEVRTPSWPWLTARTLPDLAALAEREVAP